MKKVHIIALLFLFRLSVVPPVGARTPPLPSGIHEQVTIQTNDSRSVFRQMYDLGSFSIFVPTVIQIPITNEMRIQQIAVQELPSETYLYNNVKIDVIPVPYRVTSNAAVPNEHLLSDGNTTTFVQYDIPAEGIYETTWVLRYDKPVKSQLLTYTLDTNVALPSSVSLSVRKGEQQQILIARRQVSAGNTSIAFPETLAEEWHITFSYSQPLRISELGLSLSPDSRSEVYLLQFLARPGSYYRLFTDPEGSVPIYYPEQPTFSLISDSLTVTLPQPQQNTYFRQQDRDRDSVPDTQDNCPSTANPDQRDINANRIGDACEDFDGDGLMNTSDNCPEHPNRVQQDSDGDGIGDQCDPDESRLTERLSWLPWLGILLGFGIVFGLLAVTMRKEQKPHHSTDEAE